MGTPATSETVSHPASPTERPQKRPRSPDEGWPWNSSLGLSTKKAIAGCRGPRKCLCVCGGVLDKCVGPKVKPCCAIQSWQSNGAVLCMHSMRSVPGAPTWAPFSSLQGKAYVDMQKLMRHQSRPCDPPGFQGLSEEELTTQMLRIRRVYEM